MEKRILGRTGLKVTVLGFGAMEVRGPRIWGGRTVSDDEADTILNGVLDAGINFIDTAWCYGRSEEYIGKYISGRRREYFLATKCGCSWEDKGDHDDTPHIFNKANLMRNIDVSLKRMKTDYIDVWQMHNPAPDVVEAEELIDVMNEVRDQGKVRHIAISSTVPHIDTYLEQNAFDSYQIPYSAFERQHENAISRVAEAGAGVIVRGGMARGEPGRGQGGNDRWGLWDKAGLEVLREQGESRSGFILRFTISHPDMHTTIVGTKDPEHLLENAKAAAAGPLREDVYEEAKRRLDDAGESPGS